MDSPTVSQNTPPGLSRLREWARRRPAAEEQCELCSAGLPREHSHLLDVTEHRLLCACEACAILFSGTKSARYRRVPRRVRSLPDFRMSDLEWEAMQIPIGLAFFFHSTHAGRVVALYPSPAGATESSLTLEAWQALVQDNPVLSEFEPDVEALLVNRIRDRREYYRAPIDECYRLVGLIRSHWRGLGGGTKVWEELEAYFRRLKEESDPQRGVVHA